MSDEDQLGPGIRKFFSKLDTECCPHGTAEFRWSEKDLGFGGFYFYIGDDDKVHCSNELMSKEWIKKTLCKMVDECILDET